MMAKLLGTPTSVKQWQAECDARALATVEEIKVNPARMAMAKKHAAIALAEKRRELNGLQKVVNQPVHKTPVTRKLK
jgi:hypothetical protein